jgi:hypothetical protein
VREDDPLCNGGVSLRVLYMVEDGGVRGRLVFEDKDLK